LLVAMVISFTQVYEPVSSTQDIWITYPSWWLTVGVFFKIAYNVSDGWAHTVSSSSVWCVSSYVPEYNLYCEVPKCFDTGMLHLRLLDTLWVLQNISSYYISLGRCLLLVLHVGKTETDPVIETFIQSVYEAVDKFQKYFNW
jgi:hypothetical protein